MIKDFKDTNLNVIVMDRGTDASHTFKPKLSDNSTFVFNQYTIVCEGRLAIASELPNFEFPIVLEQLGFDDSDDYIKIKFPKEIITNYIRENKIYYRVLAVKNGEGGQTIVLNFGEIWLKS